MIKYCKCQEDPCLAGVMWCWCCRVWRWRVEEVRTAAAADHELSPAAGGGRVQPPRSGDYSHSLFSTTSQYNNHHHHHH